MFRPTNIRRIVNTTNEALQEWIKSAPSNKLKELDIVSINRVRGLVSTIEIEGESKDWTVGSTLPEAWSLLLFPPVSSTTSSLSNLDGTERGKHHPPGELERMWVGGSFEFPKNVGGLRIGESVVCDSKIESILTKIGKDGRTGYYVNQTREMRRLDDDQSVVAVVEKRTHLYRAALDASTTTATFVAPKNKVDTLRPSPTPDFTLEFVFTPQHLFRFSALTFNTHKIHLDLAYCLDIEKREGLVVHGPFTALLLLNTFRNVLKTSHPLLHVQSFEYKAIRPLIVGTTARFNLAWEGDETFKTCKLFVDDDRGNVYMTGTGITQ